MSGAQGSFESVAEAERRGRKLLPPSLESAVSGGSERGITLRDNYEAYDELRFLPRLATGVSGPFNLATTVLGQDVSMPVLLSPTGAQGTIRPDGELAAARAAAKAGTLFGVSAFASKPVEEIAETGAQTIFQVFWLGSRDDLTISVERARAAGSKVLVLTMGYWFGNRKDWGSPVSPAHLPGASKIELAKAYGVEAVKAPRWLVNFARAGGMPDMVVPNIGPADGAPPEFIGKFIEWMQTPTPTWEDVAWLREQWGGPFVVKGITHPEDARRAIDAGATAVAISNYGGSSLDSIPGTVRLLPGIAEAVNGQAEILVDGGIKRGTDVVKALALGADAVMIGRAFLWGLAANGEAGVTNVIDIIRTGIEETLNALGRPSVADIRAEDVIVPADFAVAPRGAHITVG
jgi:L-lactate dehydrogenase (cytochrome)